MRENHVLPQSRCHELLDLQWAGTINKCEGCHVLVVVSIKLRFTGRSATEEPKPSTLCSARRTKILEGTPCCVFARRPRQTFGVVERETRKVGETCSA